MLEKTYQPSEIEGRIYNRWTRSGAFHCGLPDRTKADAKPYCIVIPPPNVTGSLHMGHALNNTLQDILVRFERMRGRDVLWQPGTDHAGIATQMVVERQLLEKNEPNRRSIGREAFVRRVWEWKSESGGTIINQLRRLGASCDWERERFTMDDGLSKAVLKVFVELYRNGLVYKDKRLVNWDPKLVTAISDLEVLQIETQGYLWHFKYPIKNDPSHCITVATTRPETMLGDTAVAVHPDDERYCDVVGKMCVLPLVGREIPIIADEYADPEQGSGAVKITPAHDFNDFEVGRRHDLELINILDEHAVLNQNVPADYQGLERFEARKRIVGDLEDLGLVERIDEHLHTVPYGDRSNVIIEPWLTDQWYVNAHRLAEPAIAAVEDGRTIFVPGNWSKTYFEWMRNIQPWCISRQLWWGHQIPAWYGPDGEIFVAESEIEAQVQADRHYGETGKTLERDPDVLDTWFSSALWPFSTLGWPTETPELKRYYPTNVLVTGFDIIFFWVARMMMMGLHFMKEVPFHTVYIHALVRDERGQKMSKSKGNVMDPLELIDTYGADALRFTLAAMAAQGRDIKLAASRVEGYRNFATKLWNAARFAEMNECVATAGFEPSKLDGTVNRWIAGETQRVAQAVSEGIESYRFNEAAGAAYHFVWHVFCDWYLELIKPVLIGADEPAKAETRVVTAWVLDQILKLLHPFMPFITEELWAHMAAHGPARKSMLILADWPEFKGLEDNVADEEINWVINLVTDVRSVRSEMNVPPGAKVPLELVGVSNKTAERAERHAETIMRTSRLESILRVEEMSSGSIQLIVGGEVMGIPLEDVMDITSEIDRLRREIDKASTELAKFEKKLANSQFMERAPRHVIEEQSERKLEAEATVNRLKAALERISSIA